MRKFRGLDPRTRLARWGLFLTALGIVLGGTVPHAVDALATAMATQHDALPWYASRVLAFLAYLTVAGSVIYGLLLSTGILDAIAHRPISFALHQDLASAGLGLAAVHGALLALDRTVPFTLSSLFVPFASPYRPVWVGIGQVSAYVMIIVIASFYVRRRIGQRTWRMLHYLTFLAWIGAAAHGIMSGTDTGTIWAWWLYVGSTAAITLLMAIRIAGSFASRRRGPAPARTTRFGSAGGRGSATQGVDATAV